MPYLIDSDVLIDILVAKRRPANISMRCQGDGESPRFLPWNSSLAHGIIETSAKSMRFRSAYVIVPLRSSAGTRAYHLLKRYSKSHGLHFFDSLVAATAIEEGLTLVTKNRRHFGMIEGLNLAIPEY